MDLTDPPISEVHTPHQQFQSVEAKEAAAASPSLTDVPIRIQKCGSITSLGIISMHSGGAFVNYFENVLVKL